MLIAIVWSDIVVVGRPFLRMEVGVQEVRCVEMGAIRVSTDKPRQR